MTTINEGLHMYFIKCLRMYRYVHGNTIEIISLFGWVNFGEWEYEFGRAPCMQLGAARQRQG